MIGLDVVINNRWKLCEKIGNGGFGVIFSAIDNETNDKVAVKISKKRQYLRDWSSISLEYGVYKALFAKIIPTRIPRPIEFLTEDFRHVLVLPLLGDSLKTAFLNRGLFPLSLIRSIGYQVLETLECVHGTGLLHLDIKPENILFGREGRDAHLIDFGASEYYVDEDGSRLPERSDRRFAGTLAFSSVHVDSGCERSPRDDLESFFYTIVVLYHGQLPWTDGFWVPVDDHRAVKRRCRKTLCQHLPRGIQDAWEIVAAMKFCDDVDYEQLRKLFLVEE